jgi:hypothetical protein
MRRLLVGCAVLVLLATGTVVAGSASAQSEIALIGTFTGGTTTAPAGGALTVTNFAAASRALVAAGAADVSFCLPDVDPKNCLATFDFPVTTRVTGVSGNCDAISVDLAAIHTVVGERFTLDLDVANPLVLTGGPRYLRCAIALLAKHHVPTFILARPLNRLLAG